MKKLTKVLTIIIVSAFTALTVNAEMVEYEIYEGSVVFVSKSTLETFDGKTEKIKGSFTFDPASSQSMALSGNIEVDMTSLKTGRKKRDKHMYENHLHIEEFPTSVFTAQKIEQFKRFDDNAIDLSISGTFDMHGVKNQIQPDVKATWLIPGEELEVVATFMVKLPDYNIPRPSFLVMKVAEEQAIEVKFKARKI